MEGRILLRPAVDRCHLRPRFERALILICAHDEEHAMGLA